MRTVAPEAVSDLIDYAAHFHPLEADSMLCISMTAQGAPAACARVTPASSETAVEDLAAAMLATLRQAGITSVLAVFTGDLATPACARHLLRSLRRGVEVTTAISLFAFTWTDLDTQTVGAYVPGTSNLGLHVALTHGSAPTAAPGVPIPRADIAQDKRSREIIQRWGGLTERDALALLPAAQSALEGQWPRLLSDSSASSEVEAAALTLNTPLLLTRSAALHVLYPAAAGPRTTLEHIRQGMPHGVELATARASDSLLDGLIRRGPAQTAIGPYTALAYGAWLRGQGRHASLLLDQAQALAARHAHVPLAAQVLEMREITSVRVSAGALLQRPLRPR
ncbi:hypothetical protein ACIA8I_39950 [Streptomyces rishiriensis]|uniref:hypothetical protein n=1 Tax=Streptomyces rishiriensis TaxID=68264 RepID=UPI0037937FB2